MMRIITGKARGVRLATLEGEQTRPTAERVKEAVFSMLRAEIPYAQVLDLFAGSGQLGLEAVSQGAKYALLCDGSREAVKIIRGNAEKTKLAEQCEIVCLDYAALLRSLREKKRFDVVFLDPPYAMRIVPKALKLLAECNLLAPNARVICETAGEEDVFLTDLSLREQFEILRVARYGAACITVLKPKEDIQ